MAFKVPRGTPACIFMFPVEHLYTAVIPHKLFLGCIFAAHVF